MNLINGDIYYDKEYKQLVIILGEGDGYITSINKNKRFTGKLELGVSIEGIKLNISRGDLVYVGNIHSMLKAMIKVFDELPET